MACARRCRALADRSSARLLSASRHDELVRFPCDLASRRSSTPSAGRTGEADTPVRTLPRLPSSLGLLDSSSSPAALAFRHLELQQQHVDPGRGNLALGGASSPLCPSPLDRADPSPPLQTPASRRYQSTGYAPQSTASRHRRKRLLLLVGLLGLIVLLTVRPESRLTRTATARADPRRPPSPPDHHRSGLGCPHAQEQRARSRPRAAVHDRRRRAHLDHHARRRDRYALAAHDAAQRRGIDHHVHRRAPCRHRLGDQRAGGPDGCVLLELLADPREPPELTFSSLPAAYVTSTLTDGLVIVLETATRVQTAVATVTYTAQNGASTGPSGGRSLARGGLTDSFLPPGAVGVETLTLTSLDFVTVLGYVQRSLCSFFRDRALTRPPPAVRLRPLARRAQPSQPL